MQRALFSNPTDELPGQKLLFDPDYHAQSQYHADPTLTAIAVDHREIARRMQESIRKHRRAMNAR